jgi:uncharacterized protein
MKLHESGNSGLNLFTGYDDEFLAVNHQKYQKNLIVMPRQLLTDWTSATPTTLTEADFSRLIGLGCEIVLLGTGKRQQFPDRERMRQFARAGIGLEVMDAGAACRTYNILASEGRNIAAAMLFDTTD